MSIQPEEGRIVVRIARTCYRSILNQCPVNLRSWLASRQLTILVYLQGQPPPHTGRLEGSLLGWSPLGNQALAWDRMIIHKLGSTVWILFIIENNFYLDNITKEKCVRASTRYSMKWWNVSPAWNVLESIVALGDLRNLLVVAHQGILHCVVDPLLLGVRAPRMLLSVLLVSYCDLHHFRSSHGCLGQQRQEEKRDRGRHTWPRGGSYAKGWDLCLQPRPSLAHTCTPLPPVCPLLSCQLTNKGTCGGCHSKEEEVLEPIKTHKQSWMVLHINKIIILEFLFKY